MPENGETQATRHAKSKWLSSSAGKIDGSDAARDAAIAATSVEVYDRYMRYLTGCSDFFRRGISELGQFTLTKG